MQGEITMATQRTIERGGELLARMSTGTLARAVDILDRIQADEARAAEFANSTATRERALREGAEVSSSWAEAALAKEPTSRSLGRLTLDNVERAFSYQRWTPDQVATGDEVREALTHAARVILRRVPAGPLQTRALNDLIDCRMKANAAITWGGLL